MLRVSWLPCWRCAVSVCGCAVGGCAVGWSACWRVCGLLVGLLAGVRLAGVRSMAAGMAGGIPEGSSNSVWSFFGAWAVQGVGAFSRHGRARAPRWLQELILEPFRATGGPRRPDSPRSSFWSLFGPWAGQGTQMATGAHFGAFSGHGRTTAPRWLQELSLEPFRSTGGTGHPDGWAGSPKARYYRYLLIKRLTAATAV